MRKLFLITMNFPSLNGNWVDFIIIIFLLLYLLGRRNRGFIEGVIDLAGFLLSFVVGLRYYPIVAKILMINFTFPIGIANALGFLFLIFALELLSLIFLSFAATLLSEKIIKSKSNTVLGSIPAFFSSLIILAFILTAFLVLPIRPDVKQAIINSRIGGDLTDKTLGLEKDISKIFGEAIRETLIFLTVNPGGTETIDLHFKTSDFTIDTDSEQKMFVLVNIQRQNRRIPV